MPYCWDTSHWPTHFIFSSVFDITLAQKSEVFQLHNPCGSWSGMPPEYTKNCRAFCPSHVGTLQITSNLWHILIFYHTNHVWPTTNKTNKRRKEIDGLQPFVEWKCLSADGPPATCPPCQYFCTIDHVTLISYMACSHALRSCRTVEAWVSWMTDTLTDRQTARSDFIC